MDVRTQAPVDFHAGGHVGREAARGDHDGFGHEFNGFTTLSAVEFETPADRSPQLNHFGVEPDGDAELPGMFRERQNVVAAGRFAWNRVGAGTQSRGRLKDAAQADACALQEVERFV